MKLLVLLIVSVAALNASSSANAAPGKSSDPAPDIIFVNGDIYTQSTPTRAQAIAIRDGRIVAVGSNDEIRKLKSPHTQVVDLGGHFVMPGFNDAHVHLEEAGLEAQSVDLRGTRSLQEMQQRIAASAKTGAPTDWLVGGGWDQTSWTDQKLPNRQDLDAVTGSHPAVFSRVDGHIAVANTAALKIGGVTGQTQAPRRRQDRSRCQRPAYWHSAGDSQRTRRVEDPAADSSTPSPRCRTRPGRRRTLGRHFRPGQFQLGHLPRL